MDRRCRTIVALAAATLAVVPGPVATAGPGRRPPVPAVEEPPMYPAWPQVPPRKRPLRKPPRPRDLRPAPPPVPAPPVAPAVPAWKTWVRVPAGRFTMGRRVSKKEASEAVRAEAPPHVVVLTRPFQLKATEVTVGEWIARMRTVPGPDGAPPDPPDWPVRGVTWWDALAWCNAASRAEGLAECYALEGCEGVPGLARPAPFSCRKAVFRGLDCPGYRLPTEAEWEYAARAGAGAQGPYQNDVPRLAVCRFPGPKPPVDPWQAVARRAPNRWGLYDVLGGVAEWVWDGLAAYPEARQEDPLGPPDAPSGRVLRGLSSLAPCASMRWSVRNAAGSAQVLPDAGFRPARTLAPGADQRMPRASKAATAAPEMPEP